MIRSGQVSLGIGQVRSGQFEPISLNFVVEQKSSNTLKKFFNPNKGFHLRKLGKDRFVKLGQVRLGKFSLVQVSLGQVRIVLIHFIIEHKSSNTLKKFFNPIEDLTDYGYCCHINAHLSFVNPKTANMDPNDYRFDILKIFISRNSNTSCIKF